MTRDTLENWQSEFLQLMWQVGGLAFLLYVGSPQSKEGDERVEAEPYVRISRYRLRNRPRGGHSSPGNTSCEASLNWRLS